MKNRKKKQEMAPQQTSVPMCVLPVEQESLDLLKTVESTQEDMNAYYLQMLEGATPEEIQAKGDSLKRSTANMTRALTQAAAISDEYHARWKDIQNEKKRSGRLISVPSNAAVDLSESQSEHFARGLNLYKILLICFVGSFAGVVVEMLWCLISNGYLESRAGLVYGPFNLLYGVGAVALTLCLYRFRNRGTWISFLGGMIVGSVIEYVCSWGQELLFGSCSWDYSHMPFNLNGRICLLYSIFWGVLGVLWIKTIYPIMAEWILKIPNKPGKILTWAVTIFFVFNSFMTLAAMTRWTQRMEDIPAQSAFAEFLDDRFPDQRMEKVFANMEFLEES